MTSLFTALSGLKSHQGWLDVIGNNLANANTSGFKVERASLADNFAQTLRFATGAQGTTGGVNPLQFGTGVHLGNISRNFSQGALQSTGRTFDLALEGQGFFALQGPNTSLYTRVGTFGLDGASNLVDQGTGLAVLDNNGSPVNLDLDSLFPPNATTTMEFAGNLPAEVTGPLAEVLTTATGLANGTSAVLAGSASAAFTIPAGETWTMDLIVNGGAPQQVSIPATGLPIGPTEVANAINAQVTGVTAAVNGGGFVELTTTQGGDSASIKINPGATGLDLAGTMGLSTSLVRGTQVTADASTNLNDLSANTVDYQAGDTIEIVGADFDGSPVNATFVFGTDGTTLGDLVGFLNAQYSGSTVSLNGNGQIEVASDSSGEANLLLSLSDGTSNVGASTWTTHGLSVTTEGSGPDEVQTSMEVFDNSGTAHTLSFTYQRQGDGSWSVIPSVSDGQILSNTITGINFAEDGSPLGLSGVDTSVSVQFDNQTTPQTLTLGLGADGKFDGLTLFGSPSSVFASEQDGYGVGEIANVAVDQDGSIVGFYSNGQQDTLATIGVTVFSNAEGLALTGNNLWQETANSGRRIAGRGATGPAGSVIGGNLERSNVDTAEQFVNLIEAQRGYQANSRMISVQDEILQETVNLV